MDGILQSYVMLFPGCTYEFDQSDSSNGTHPLRFATAADAAGSTEYTTGVTTNGTPGSAGAWTKIEITTSTPSTLYFYCTAHSGMGNEVNIPNNYFLSNTNDRMICGGGDTSAGSFSNVIQMIQMRSKGNASDYGDLSHARQSLATGVCSSTTRGLFYAGDDSGPTSYIDTIDWITMASTGNAVDFGNSSYDESGGAGFSNQTRGGRCGGFTGGPNAFANNVIDYVTIASLGNSSDFGDLTSDRYGNTGLSSPSRALSGGGATYPGTTVYQDIMDYITIASTGNSIDFGNLLAAIDNMGASASSTRGVFTGGSSPTNSNVMQYITIASTGDSQDFGDLTVAMRIPGGNSNNTLGITMGGLTPSLVNTVEEFTIATTGNAADFGDLTETTGESPGTVSPNHGGLQ